jgi:hypothetical protein
VVDSGVRLASDALRTASADGVEEDIKTANANLKRVTKKAKREWADDIVTKEGTSGKWPGGGRGGRTPRSQGFAPLSRN